MGRQRLQRSINQLHEQQRVTSLNSTRFCLIAGVHFKELLGLCILPNEGAKFWLGVMTELKNRGVQVILIAAVDGLTGFPDAIAAVFP
jgi:hypothetical protein